MSIIKSILISCYQCGRVWRVPPSREHLQYCSTTCLKEARRIVAEERVAALKRYASLGLTRKEAAAALKLSYPHTWRLIKKAKIGHLFPDNGVDASIWAKLRPAN